MLCTYTIDHRQVALPGGPGTLSEVQLARVYGRPCVAFLGPGAGIGGLATPAELGVPVARTVAEVEAFLDEQLGPGAGSLQYKVALLSKKYGAAAKE